MAYLKHTLQVLENNRPRAERYPFIISPSYWSMWAIENKGQQPTFKNIYLGCVKHSLLF